MSGADLSNNNEDDTKTSLSERQTVIFENKEESSDLYHRFSGVGRLYNNAFDNAPDGLKSSAHDNNSHRQSGETDSHLRVVDRLSASTVIIIGIGGVGSWAAEALCRSGVGNLVLVDMDDICVSNTNRQLHALSSSVGKSKIDETKKRLQDINPECQVTTIFDFISKDNVDVFFDNILLLNKSSATVCIDAIDNMNEKTAIIWACVTRGLPIITCGGAAGRTDPTKIVCDDLTKAMDDRLLFKTRKLLRKHHGFPKGPPNGTPNKHKVKRWNVPAVFSTELQKHLTSESDYATTTSSFRRCDSALGTACFVTGSYGFAAASRAVEMIASGRLEVPIVPDDRT